MDKPTRLTYLKHSSGQARTIVRRPDGGRRTVYLGKYGSPESYAELARLGAERSISPSHVTYVSELLERFWFYAAGGQRQGPDGRTETIKGFYTDADGRPTKELINFQLTLRPLRRLYGHTRVRDFGPLAFRAVQAAIASGSWLSDEERASRLARGKPCRVCRKTTNQRCNRIRRVWKWAASFELIPLEKYEALRTVPGIPAGRGLAVEHPDVESVPGPDLRAALEQLGPVPRAICQFILYTGARPGETVPLRLGEINRDPSIELQPGVTIHPGGRVWVYRPDQHKTMHLGHRRVILIGPKAQETLQPLLEGLSDDDYVFSPRRAMAAWRAEQRRRRQTPVQPSQLDRRLAGRPPRKGPGLHYTVDSLAQAVRKACARAEVEPWHPHQLRHNAASILADDFGPEVARIALGQETLDVTRIYIQDDYRKVAAAIGQVG
jgi:integrase